MTNDVTSVFLFFSAAILWQIVSHYIRMLMLKHYISNGYYFEFSDVSYMYVPDTKLFNIGLGNLWSRRTKATFSVSCLADGVYVFSCFVAPVLIFGFFYGDGVYVSIQEIDVKLFLWIAVNFGLAIPLNALRYRKFKNQIKSYVFHPRDN